MKQLDSEDVFKLLSPVKCTEIMRETLTALELGKGVQYLRTPHLLPNNGIFAFMPAWLDNGYFGAKVLTVFHSNAGSIYPAHQGSVMLFEAEHGSLVALVDAAAITQVRTGAVSAVATDLLANQDASALCLMGCGVQGESHLKAIMEVRRLEKVFVWDISPERSSSFAARMAAETGLDIEACEKAEQAVRPADIICTLTPSTVPILESGWIKQGAHINAVGACTAKDRELPSALMAAGKVYGDSVESVMKESGDFLIPMQEGLYGESHLKGAIGAVAAGKIQGRSSRDEITIFDALGLAIEDITAASYVYQASL